MWYNESVGNAPPKTLKQRQFQEGISTYIITITSLGATLQVFSLFQEPPYRLLINRIIKIRMISKRMTIIFTQRGEDGPGISV